MNVVLDEVGDGSFEITGKRAAEAAGVLWVVKESRGGHNPASCQSHTSTLSRPMRLSSPS